MKSPHSLTNFARAALAALSLFTLALIAHAQDPKPSSPPEPGGGGPGRVTQEERDSDGPFRTNQVETKAVLTSKPAPGFTDAALDNDTYGVVRLRAVLTSKGEVTDISVVKGLPDGLTERSIAVAKQIRFTPARRYGHVVSQYVTLEYNFNLEDEEADKHVEILEQPKPAYTDEARRNRVAGRVVIVARFHRDGTVSSPIVLEKLPDGLTEKALESLNQIKFVPAEMRGRKVTVYRRVEYIFSPDATDAKP